MCKITSVIRNAEASISQAVGVVRGVVYRRKDVDMEVCIVDVFERPTPLSLVRGFCHTVPLRILLHLVANDFLNMRLGGDGLRQRTQVAYHVNVIRTVFINGLHCRSEPH